MQGQSHCPTGSSGRSKSGWYHGVFPGFRQMRLRPFFDTGNEEVLCP